MCSEGQEKETVVKKGWKGQGRNGKEGTKEGQKGGKEGICEVRGRGRKGERL